MEGASGRVIGSEPLVVMTMAWVGHTDVRISYRRSEPILVSPV